MDLAQFSSIAEATARRLFADYYPRSTGLSFRDQVLYLASEYARIKGVVIPELNNQYFVKYYTQDDDELLANCNRYLGIDCKGQITRDEAVYICSCYWSNDSSISVPFTKRTRRFLEGIVVDDSWSSLHLEWVAFLFLNDEASALGLERLKHRDFGFNCEFQFSSQPPATQILRKLQILLTMNHLWPRSPALQNLSLGGDQIVIVLASAKGELTHLLEYLRKNPSRHSVVYDEMRAFISTFDYANISGLATELDEMQVDALGRIWIDDVRTITSEFAPKYYKTVVLDDWNETLANRGYATLTLR